MISELAFAFMIGSIATVNPCGFALLPAYLARRLSRDGEEHRQGTRERRHPISNTEQEIAPQTAPGRFHRQQAQLDVPAGKDDEPRCG